MQHAYYMQYVPYVLDREASNRSRFNIQATATTCYHAVGVSHARWALLLLFRDNVMISSTVRIVFKFRICTLSAMPDHAAGIVNMYGVPYGNGCSFISLVTHQTLQLQQSVKHNDFNKTADHICNAMIPRYARNDI